MNPLFLRTFFHQLSITISMFFVLASPGIAEIMEIESFGHSSLIVRGGGYSVLLNPFKAVGCASGLIEPNVNPDIILASSELLDEGYWKKKGVFFVKPGSYVIDGLRLEGFSTAHDRMGGRRFGYGTFWQWEQGGLTFAHLGGVAGSLSRQERILLGQPDVLFIGVGGGAKVYNAKEAAEIIKDLNPKIVIPVQYVRGDIKKSDCDQTGIQPFLEATKGIESRNVGNNYIVPKNLPDKTIINLMP